MEIIKAGRALRTALLATTALSATALAAAPAHAIDWLAGTGDWHLGANWNTGTVPGPGDSARVDNNGVARILSGTAESGVTFIGHFSGQTGRVEVDGTGRLNNSGMSVAVLGNGSLSIANGGSVTTTGFGYLGENGGSNGVVTVDGNGSVWSITGRLFNGLDGNGTLNVTDGGAVATGDLVAIGTNASSLGSVAVDGSGSTLTSGTSIFVGASGNGTLTISNEGLVSAAGGGGPVNIAQQVGSTGVLNIGAASGDAATAAGTLLAGTILFGNGAGSILFNHTSSDFELDADISGSGTLRQIGSGTTTLTGNNSTFGGDTFVEAGTFIVNGLFGGGIGVMNGMLGGTGTIGATTLGAGAIVAPGNSIGTLNVAGTFDFGAGSAYEVETNDGGNAAGTNNDWLHATGAVTIDGSAMVAVRPENGTDNGLTWAPSTLYTILTAGGGVTGIFGGVTDSFAFLDSQLSYDANNVYLTLNLVADLQDAARTPNQFNVAVAANDLGLGNPLYDAILLMTEEEARAAFDSLSGEAYGSVGTAIFNTVQQIRNVLQARLQMFAGGALKSSGGVQVAALGDFMPSTDTLSSDRPAAWGQVFGSWGVNDESVNVAKLERRSAGFLGGADKSVGEASRVGVALGYSRSNFDVSARSSSGGSDGFHVAGYGGTKLGIVDLGSTVSYSYGRSEAERTVIVGLLTNNLAADYDTHTFQASVEAATDIDMSSVVLTPFAGLAVTHARTDGFTETGGPAALTVSASDNTTGVSSLGLRLRRETGKVALSGSLAWRHAFGDVDPASRIAFASAPATSFLVRGAPVSEDALAVGSYLGLEITDRTTLTLGYDGEFASDVRDHSLKAEVRVEF
ncbi:MAG: autotransporter domain-containing protein [Parvibaculum sp.]|nr:autotransporter domain-containing protein [Parvibaculum sp.]